eukprot:jgi/Tetstr1/457910/TSEL_044428.t1
MANTRLPDDMYLRPEEGGLDPPTATTDIASLTELVQRMIVLLDELDSRTLPGQQQHEQNPISSTLDNNLAGGDDPPPGFLAKNPGLAAFIDPRDWNDYPCEDKLTYLQLRFTCKTTLTGEDRVAKRLFYNRLFDTAAAERSSKQKRRQPPQRHEYCPRALSKQFFRCALTAIAICIGPLANLELPKVEQLAEAIAATISQRTNTPPELQHA